MSCAATIFGAGQEVFVCGFWRVSDAILYRRCETSKGRNLGSFAAGRSDNGVRCFHFCKRPAIGAVPRSQSTRFPACQDDDYIELSDECRIAVIKRAHLTSTALIELHSHPFDSPWAPAFSFADMAGLRETVPHLWWRLPDRPYGAIVVAPNGFDSLVWLKCPHTPACLTALRVDGEELSPTGMTLGGRNVSQM